MSRLLGSHQSAAAKINDNDRQPSRPVRYPVFPRVGRRSGSFFGWRSILEIVRTTGDAKRCDIVSRPRQQSVVFLDDVHSKKTRNFWRHKLPEYQVPKPHFWSKCTVKGQDKTTKTRHVSNLVFFPCNLYFLWASRHSISAKYYVARGVALCLIRWSLIGLWQRVLG